MSGSIYGKDIGDLDSIIAKITDDVKGSVDINPTFTVAEVNTIKADLSDEILTQIKPDLSAKIQATLETSLHQLSEPKLTAFKNAIDIFLNNPVDTATFQTALLSNDIYGTTISTMESHIQNAANSTISSQTLPITVQSFIDIFGANTPSLTFTNMSVLSNSLITLISSNQNDAAKIIFAESIAPIVSPPQNSLPLFYSLICSSFSLRPFAAPFFLIMHFRSLEYA